MGNLLYLVHRLPYPPNKGDKARSGHARKHSTADHRVFLRTLVDEQDDEQHSETLRAICPIQVNRRLQDEIFMAMARPIFGPKSCGEALEADASAEFYCVECAENFVLRSGALLRTPECVVATGAAGRCHVLQNYFRDAHLTVIDQYLTQGATA